MVMEERIKMKKEVKKSKAIDGKELIIAMDELE